VKRVGWVTHHLMDGRSGEVWLPGTVGGAEMTDAAMIAAAPDDVEVTVIPSGDWRDALQFDRIVVTGTDLLDAEAMLTLAEREPVVWVHHQQEFHPARQRLFANAKPFLTMSALHSRVEQAAFGVPSQWCHGAFDPDVVKPAERKNRVALWAARDHPQKGRVNARLWAFNNGMPLVEVTNQPHDTVLYEMSQAHTFVFLPAAFDACPRTLIEAELAGCEIVTNGLAGRRDQGSIRQILSEQIRKFWVWVG
jgi:hypothetical protein